MTLPDTTADPALSPRSTPAWRLFAIPGILALLGYMVLYQIDSRLRFAKGPWEVTFQNDSQGLPTLHIAHPPLGISNVTVRFLGETTPPTLASPAVVRFDTPLKPLPFGTTAFDDLMYLPGTVVLHCFGHEVQMLPRGLFLNRREQAWSSNQQYDLRPEDKLPSLEPPKKNLTERRTN